MLKQLSLTSVLRLAAVGLVCLYGLSIWAEWHQVLSLESTHYEQNYPDAMRTGLEPIYALSKAAWLAGSLLGFGGVVRIFQTSQGGLAPMLISGPLIAWGTILQAPPSNYPTVETTTAFFLWCATCALWGAVVTLCGVRQHR